MKKKKVMVLIGDWPRHFIEDLKFFEEVSKRFNSPVVKVNKFRYKISIGNKEIIFQFCFGPDDDEVWHIRSATRGKEKGG
ncbi:hypothetical protein FJZ21_02075 [Candidatus Pacearchaeota archaeon]|nr:hypothetical protein [Candidatus Pacearchaeota archaeon]